MKKEKLRDLRMSITSEKLRELVDSRVFWNVLLNMRKKQRIKI